MLLYYCAREDELERIGRDGLGDRVALWTTLPGVQDACMECILVVDSTGLRLTAGTRPGRLRAEGVPPASIRNLAPYAPPGPVVAAGGCIVRRGALEPEILLILRRGVWDLPKGKLDRGEAIEACALREVKEEIGVDRLEIVCALGTTEHGYPDEGRYLVKTTHWYLMQTPETEFTPERREGIEAVAWVPWRRAIEQLGYDTLRRHLAEQTDAARTALGCP